MYNPTKTKQMNIVFTFYFDTLAFWALVSEAKTLGLWVILKNQSS